MSADHQSSKPVACLKCPLCGSAEVHEHSGVERTIYRNGQKAALAMLSNPMAYLHPASGFVIAASRFEEHVEARQRQHQDPFYYVPLFEKPVLP